MKLLNVLFGGREMVANLKHRCFFNCGSDRYLVTFWMYSRVGATLITLTFINVFHLSLSCIRRFKSSCHRKCFAHRCFKKKDNTMSTSFPGLKLFPARQYTHFLAEQRAVLFPKDTRPDQDKCNNHKPLLFLVILWMNEKFHRSVIQHVSTPLFLLPLLRSVGYKNGCCD